MYSELFEEIGLSPNEAKIYETLLSTGESSVSEISSRSNIHRRNVYDALSRLMSKGLALKIFEHGENRFQAVNPDKLSEIIRERETKLKSVLPALKKMYDSEPIKEAAYIYKGIEGYKNYRMDLLKVAEETYFFGAKGLWFSPQIDESFRETYIKEFDRRKIPYKMLFDPRIKETLPEAVKFIKGNYKFLPKGYETPGVVDIFGDHVVTFTSVGLGQIDDNVTLFVTINKELAETYKTWFRFVWDMCPDPEKEKNK